MSNISYDIDKLKQAVNIDTESALKNFNNIQEYFDKLTVFAKDSGRYLADYKPEILIIRDNARKSMLKELQEIRSMLTLLGMTRISYDLAYLESAVLKKDAAALATELSEFYANMKKIAKQLDSAQISIPIVPVPKAPPKRIILAVDDKPEILTAIVDMLKDNFTVAGVTSGKAALKMIEKHTPELFLLDIEMPQMDGYELARQIRQHEKFNASPIVFLTGKNTRDSVIEAIKNGGNDYLLKPVDKDLLLSKVRQFLK